MYMTETKFSKICKTISNIFLVLSIIAPFIIAGVYGKVEDYSWKNELASYSRDWGLTIIYYIVSFVSTFLAYVGFGAVSEHLELLAYIAKNTIRKE